MGRCMKKVENHWIKQNYLYIRTPQPKNVFSSVIY